MRMLSFLRYVVPSCALFLLACGVPGTDDVAANTAALMDVEDPNGTPTTTNPTLPGKIHGHDRNGTLGSVCDPSLPSPCKGSLVCCYPCGIPGCSSICMTPEPLTGQCPMHQ